MENLSFKNILMPTDFTDLAESALAVAIEICKNRKASLTLLHVVDRLAYLSPAQMFVPNLTEGPDVARTIEENIEGLAGRLSAQHGFEIHGIIETGSPADTICRVAARDNHDLIILGTHGASGAREMLMGSTAFKVVKHSPCPVLSIPGNWDKRSFRRVVFPVRIMPNTLEKYTFARQLMLKEEAHFLVIGLTENENANNITKLTELVNQLKLRLVDDQVKFNSVVFAGNEFSKKILDAAETFDADLITIVANIELEWNDILVGPFAQQVINHSKRPVLSITPSKAKFQYSDLE